MAPRTCGRGELCSPHPPGTAPWDPAVLLTAVRRSHARRGSPMAVKAPKSKGASEPGTKQSGVWGEHSVTHLFLQDRTARPASCLRGHACPDSAAAAAGETPRHPARARALSQLTSHGTRESLKTSPAGHGSAGRPSDGSKRPRRSSVTPGGCGWQGPGRARGQNESPARAARQQRGFRAAETRNWSGRFAS